MKPQLKTLTWSDFDKFEPCYSPQEVYGDFSGTILDILKDKRIPNTDKIWAFMRKGIMDDKTLRLFAVRCARQVQHLMEDERSINALDVVERYANGLATEEELAKAREAAWKAAEEASGEVAGKVRSIEIVVARKAAWETTWENARKAARKASWAAAWEAARGAVRDVAMAAQVQNAIELINQFYEV